MAQKCYASLGNASKTFYLSEMVKLDEEYKESWGPNIPCPEVQARLALLNADIR